MAECIQCLMDSSQIESVRIDKNGSCNQCLNFEKNLATRTTNGPEGILKLLEIAAKNRQKHLGREYDSILGISGGVDSCFLAAASVSNGFKPLLVHVDNGWNSPIAVANIELVVDALDLDLVTYVLDWEEFSNLQKAFLKASVPDGEIPTDFAIQALLWRAAREHGIKTILTGMNYLTESGHIPDWAYGHSDWRYIKGINRKFGLIPLSRYPKMTLFDLFRFTYISRIKRVSILNYLDYNRLDAENYLVKSFDWNKYEGKHSESIYTKFYQEFILPSKFGIDKRILHLSDLIRAGQLTKIEAKVVLQKNLLTSHYQNRSDAKYVMKRLKFTATEFEAMLDTENKKFSDFPNNSKYINLIRSIINNLRRFKLYPH